MKSMGWTDKTLMQTLDSEKRPNNAEIENHRKDIQDGQRQRLPVQCCINCFCDCKPKQMPNDGKENQEMMAAAMNRKDNQDAASRLCEHTNRCAKKCKYVKPRTCMISGGVELVPLLARRRAMQRPISLSTTDVTKYPTEKKYVRYRYCKHCSHEQGRKLSAHNRFTHISSNACFSISLDGKITVKAFNCSMICVDKFRKRNDANRSVAMAFTHSVRVFNRLLLLLFYSLVLLKFHFIEWISNRYRRIANWNQHGGILKR